MQSRAKTVAEYLAELPPDRAPIIKSLRQVIKKNLPPGFREQMNYGMIGYVVPHSLYPAGYHVTPELPLPFMNIASQKSHIAVYHMAMLGSLEDWFRANWPKHSTKKLDMGKSCIRFKKPEDVPLALMGQLATRLTPEAWIEEYEKQVAKARKK
jgi:hypothetical protein